MVLKAKINRSNREIMDDALVSVRKEDMIRLNSLIPVSLHKRLKIHAAKSGSGVTISSVVIEAIENHLIKIS
jgi:hypothetical protein